MKPVPWPLPRSQELEQLWRMGAVVPLAVAAASEQAALAAALGPSPARTLEALAQTWGPGVLVGSGGSSGRRRWCLQPLSNLQASADATAAWLQQLGLEPQRCLHLNPLPLQHVSGLLPLVRARRWGCAHQVLEPAVLRDPLALAAAVRLPADRPVLISLVPTQLQRLMAAQEGLAWLRQLALIWVGGAPLPA
ncbi:MAG: o-succinylbenzoate--CoA ligase, partial [Prochlorococcaceae cyanobacterium]